MMKNTPSHDCPLCEKTEAEETTMRVHLMVDHRKSEVADELLTA